MNDQTRDIKWSFILLTVLLTILIATILIIRYANKKPLIGKNPALTLSTLPPHTFAQHRFAKPLPWIEESIKSGDSLAHIFLKMGLPYPLLTHILKNRMAKDYLTQLKPGQKIYFQLNKKKQFQQLKYALNADKTLFVSNQQNKINAHIEKTPLTSALLYKSGTVTHSLADAAYQAGLTPAMTQQLSAIFAGDINYQHELKPGAHFAFLYKEAYLNGKKYKPGDIMVAEFTNHGHTYKAIRYTYPIDHSGYYTPDGHGVEPLFLRAPLKYKYISSGFTYHRMDPYLHVMRPHLGIDYAANVGTPIHSIGDGRVIFVGKDDGYGNAVIIRYNRKYKTLYGHLQHFAHNVHTGKYVKRGETIGYVGNTGWSTGPHLHFEMYVYGVPRDPLKLHFPGGKSIPSSYEDRFLVSAKRLLAELNKHTDNGKTSNAS